MLCAYCCFCICFCACALVVTSIGALASESVCLSVADASLRNWMRMLVCIAGVCVCALWCICIRCWQLGAYVLHVLAVCDAVLLAGLRLTLLSVLVLVFHCFCLLLVACCLLLVACCLLLVACCLMLDACCLLLVACVFVDALWCLCVF